MVLAGPPVRYVTSISSCMFPDDDWQGTWQFMAADLIENPHIAQKLIHDIESAFYILLWMAVCYVKSTWDPSRRSSFVRTIFHPPVFGVSGGPWKATFMRASRQEDMPKFPDNESLTKLLTTLRMSLSFRHMEPPEKPSDDGDTVLKDVIQRTLHQSQDAQGAASVSVQDPTDTIESTSKEAYEERLKTYNFFTRVYDSHTFFIDLIDGYLRNPWPNTEAATSQEFVLPHTEKSAVRSGSKRCKEGAEESERGDARKRSSLRS